MYRHYLSYFIFIIHVFLRRGAIQQQLVLKGLSYKNIDYNLTKHSKKRLIEYKF